MQRSLLVWVPLCFLSNTVGFEPTIQKAIVQQLILKAAKNFGYVRLGWDLNPRRFLCETLQVSAIDRSATKPHQVSEETKMQSLYIGCSLTASSIPIKVSYKQGQFMVNFLFIDPVIQKGQLIPNTRTATLIKSCWITWLVRVFQSFKLKLFFLYAPLGSC